MEKEVKQTIDFIKIAKEESGIGGRMNVYVKCGNDGYRYYKVKINHECYIIEFLWDTQSLGVTEINVKGGITALITRLAYFTKTLDNHINNSYR